MLLMLISTQGRFPRRGRSYLRQVLLRAPKEWLRFFPTNFIKNTVRSRWNGLTKLPRGSTGLSASSTFFLKKEDLILSTCGLKPITYEGGCIGGIRRRLLMDTKKSPWFGRYRSGFFWKTRLQ